MERDEYLRAMHWGDAAMDLFEQEHAEAMLDAEAESPGTFFPRYSEDDLRDIAEALGVPVEKVLPFRESLVFYGCLFGADIRDKNTPPPSVQEKNCEVDLVALHRLENRLRYDLGYLDYVSRAAEGLGWEINGKPVNPRAVVWDLIKVLDTARATISGEIGHSSGVRNLAEYQWANNILRVFEMALDRQAGRSRPGGPFTRGLQAAARVIGHQLTEQDAFRLVGKFKEAKARLGVENFS